MSDPLLDLFGPGAKPDDPLRDVFGPESGTDLGFDITKNPFAKRPATMLERATGMPDETEGGRVSNAVDELAKVPPPTETELRLFERRQQHAQESEEANASAYGKAQEGEVAKLPTILQPLARLGLGMIHGFEGSEAEMAANRADYSESVGLATPESVAGAEEGHRVSDFHSRNRPEGPMGWFGNAVGTIAGSLWSGGKEALKAGAAGAVAGGLAGAPEGGVGAIPGALAGGSAGLTFGWLADSYRTNAGAIYGDLKNVYDPGTGQPISESTRFAATSIGGSIMATLDTISFGVLSAPLTRPLRKKLTGEIATEIIAQTRKDAIKAGALEYLKVVGTETVTETIQQVVQDVSEDLAKTVTSDNFETLFNDPVRRKEVVKNAVQTALITAAGMSVIGAPGGVSTVRSAERDMLGRGAPKAAEPGRSYNQADAIAELGMSGEEAEEFVRTGTDPRGAQAMRDIGIAPEITPADEASPIPTSVIEEGKGLLGEALAGNAPANQTPGLQAPKQAPSFERIAAITKQSESHGDPNAVSPKGAVGTMQTMPGTLRDPGFGVQAAQNDSPAELERVGRDYLAAMMRRYGSNMEKAWAAYNWGPGRVDDAVREHGAEWLKHAPEETRNYVAKNMAALGGEETAEASSSAPAVAAAEQEIEGVRDSLKRRLGEDIFDFAAGQRVDVTQNDQTVPGTVQEVYGEGEHQGVRIARDDGTMFDEVVKRAREYGARITHPAEPAAPIESKTGEPVKVPDAAEPKFVAFPEDSGTLGIPRAEMPQIKAEHRGAMTNFLNARGIEHEEETVAADSLKPSQAEFSPDKVQQAKDYEGGDRAILVSQDGYVVDGHHQALAAAENNEDVRIIRLKAPIREVLAAAHEFPSSTVDEGGETTADEKQAEIVDMPGLKARHSLRLLIRHNEDGYHVEVEGELGGFSGGTWSHGKGATREAAIQAALPHADRNLDPSRFGSSANDTNRKQAEQMRAWLREQGGETPAEESKPTGPRVFVNRVGRDGKTDAERDHPLPKRTEVSDGRFKATWTAKSFREIRKASGDPHRESGVAHELVRGWLDGKASNLEALDQHMEDKAESIIGIAQPDGFNPRDAYTEGFYAAAMGETREIRLRGIRDTLGVGPAHDAIAKKLGAEPIADQPTEAPIAEAEAAAILEKAAPHQEELERFGNRANVEFKSPGLKSKARIVEKVLRENYGSPAELKDIVRGMFLVETPEQMNIASRAVLAMWPNVEDKGRQIVRGGFRDHKLIIDFGEGVKGEVQIVPREVWAAKKGGASAIYKRWRLMDKETPEAQALEQQMEAAYAKAVEGTAWENAFSAAEASGNLSANAASDSTEPSQPTSPGAAPQEPSRQAAAQGLPLEEPSATGRPSYSSVVTDSNVGTAADVGNNLAREGFSAETTFRAIEEGRGADLDLNFQAWAIRMGYAVRNPGAEGGTLELTGKGRKEQAKIADMHARAAAARASVYGATNRVFTKDKADAARQLIRDRLTRQVASGFDPELAMAGMQLAGFHIEAGARKFAAFTKALSDDLGLDLSRLKPYIAAWYNGARDLLEGHGEDISDMDGAGAVRAAVGMIPDASLPTSVDGIVDEGVEDAGTAAAERTESADRGSDDRAGPGDAQGIVDEREPEQGADRPGEPGDGQLRAGEEPDRGEGAAEEPGAVGQRSGQRDHAGDQRGRPASARSSRRVRTAAKGFGNFYARPGDLKREGGWLATANRNLDIIELVNKLDEEGRPANLVEQALLAKWVGWGASEMRNKLFASVDRRSMTIQPSSFAGEWQTTIQRARDLIKGPDLETALQSVQYAHYTSEGIIRGMWDALTRMGFGGGRILEPGMGIGHFFTSSPAAVAEHSSYTGIELDAFTAKIAKYLLPEENIIQGDFTKQAFPDGFFDAAIGNPPFSSTKVLNDPAYKRQRLSLHNYFFAKSLDKVRPGGLVAFITSRYTMDALDPKARQFMADRADLVGAIRLPETAFKENAGTEVVTDVLFFQRRMPGAEAGGQAWLKTKEVSVAGTDRRDKKAINEYFAAHPEMVLGRHALTRGMYRDNDLTVEPFASKGTIEKQFAEAAAKLPADIYTEQPRENVKSLTAKTFERDFAPASSKEGGLYAKDGKVLIVDSGSGVPVEAVFERVKPSDLGWLKGYVKLRDALKEAQRAQLDDTADWETKLDALRKAYRTFTRQHGRIKEFTTYERTTKDEDGEEQTLTYRRFKWDRLLFDIESPLVQSLERITDAGEVEDGPFLLGRTLNKPVRPKIESVEDALAVTLDEIGKLDLEYVGKLIGKSQDEVVALLGEQVFQSPAGEWQTSDEYLSGNVLQKLEEAQAAAAAAPEFQRNVQALLAVQPPPLSYDRITVRLGAPWLRAETVQEFAGEVLGMNGVPISYDQATAHWLVEGANARWRRSTTDDWGTSERSPLELLDAVLNNRTIKVTKKIDKKEVTDADATAAAVEAAKKIADRFKTWLWEDSLRTTEYVETYNRSYNNIAPRRFDGSHLTTPGLSSRYKLYPHQKRAVWRIIQTGNAYLAHAVGAGKTFEMIVGGQEMRRLGLIKKPMYAVPNHMLKQFSQEFLEAYPAANIMVADEHAFHTGNRQRFLAQAALNDPDAIILTHSSFGKVDTSPAMRDKVVKDMVAELEDALADAKGTDTPRHQVSRIEKQIEQLKRRFEGRTGTGKDKLLTFDEMGVDFLFVDEAHEFRKLDFATNRVAKGIDSQGSARALDLFIKSQWLEQRNPGRSMVMSSGTPVTNTMAELYTVMRFLALKKLDRDHIRAFDAWANMFGEVAPGYERNAAGGYEIVERFSRFVNVPELMKRVREFMDVLLSAELGDLVQRPKVKGGGPQNIIAPMSDELADYMEKTLNTRLETSRAWKPSPDQPGNPDPVINIITDARLASIDMRFVTVGRKSDPGSKLNRMIGEIARIHQETAKAEYLNRDGTKQPRKGSTQIVFSPVGFGEQVAITRGFDVRGWIDGELQRLGVKKSEIGWMSDANSHAKKDQLQKDVRSGKVRILIGSPKNMGTGLNVQDRLIALHYLAPPWYPADVTQPHGRIERQGNLNPEIGFSWYATEGTYDSTGWGMVARKQKFIDDAMSGDDSVRVLDDISEINMFEMAAALAAGDDRVIRIAELGGEVEKLTRLKGAHATDQRTLRGDIQTYTGFEIPRLEKKLADLKEANAKRGIGFRPFEMAVGGETFERQGEAGEALKAAAQAVIDSSVNVERTEIGKLYGEHPIFIAPFRGELRFEMDVGPLGFKVGDDFRDLEHVDPVGLSRRFETAISRIPSELQDTSRQLDTARTELGKAQRKYGAPFPEEAGLSEAVAERARLQAEMTEETKAKQGLKSDGTAGPLAELATDSAAFQRWFGDSAVVNENGTPKVVYHFTDADFDEFKYSDDIGFHFGSFDQANQRQSMIRGTVAASEVDGDNILPVYLKIKNPLRVPDLNDWTPVRVVSELTQLGIINERQAELALDRQIIDRDWVREKLAAKGYDGMVYDNATEGRGDSYIAFSPEQIKSATGNRGTFDPSDPSILASRGPEMGRREFIKGAVAVTGGFMLGGRLYAKPVGLLSTLADSTHQAVPLDRPLRWIAANSDNASYRRIAQKLIPLTQGVKLRSVQFEQVGVMGGGIPLYAGFYKGEDAELVPSDMSLGTAHGEFMTSPKGEDQVWLAKTSKERELDGWNEATVMHESLHAALIRYYGVISRRRPNPRAALLAEGFDREAFARSDRSAEAINEIHDIWKEAVALWKKQGEGLKVEGDDITMSAENARISNGLANTDEFVAYALSDENIQKFLKQLPSSKPDGRTLWQRFVDAIRALFGVATVSRSALDDVMDATNRLLDEVHGQPPVAPGKGNRDEAGSLKSVAAPITPSSPDFGGDSERRWQEAKKGIGGGPGLIETASAWWQDLTGGFTRHWRNLPNSPRFADVSQQLRKLEAAPDAAMTASVRYLRGLVGKMDPAEYDLFSRKVVLDDLAWDAGEGRELPFGFTPSSLVAARRNIDAQVNLNPKLIRALRSRRAHNDVIADAMVRAGVLTREQIKNPAYFRHMVLDYARHEAALARSPSKVKSPYWAKRMGSTLDINANLLEAELDWLQKAQIDTVTADTIESIKAGPLNIREELRTRGRTDNRAALAAALASNPAARKEDGWFRSNIARGFKIVQDELEAGHLDPIPPHLQGMADDILADRRDGEPPFAFLAWVLDHDLPGAMGAGMVLKYSGLRKQWQRKLLGDQWVDTDDVKALVKHYRPEGMVAWQPTDGRHLFTAKTISESALDMFVTSLADTASPGLDRAELASALGSVRQQLVVGGDRYTMVLPEELAATLDEFGDRRGEGMVARVFGGIQSAWKRWVLINPRRFLKYNLNNQTGDLDAVIAGKPRTLLRVKEAWGMLRAASKGTPSARYTEALERGVFTSGLSAQEIPDINRLSQFRHLTERSNRPDKLMVAGIGKVWRALQDSTNFREALFRLAAYLEYADEIESGKPQREIGYGASIPKIVDAVTDPKDRAALLARDLIGDYGSISVAGGWLRRYLIPFWSWLEINTRRYWRLTANAYTTGKVRGIATGGLLGGAVAVRTAASLYARIALLYGLLYLWNHVLFPDEEDDLNDLQKAQLHLIIGRDSDGKVISLRTQGAFSDVMATLGFPDAVAAFNHWRDGQGSLGSVITDMAKAPVNRVATAATPLINEPVEQMIGQELWPDIFNPRTIHDRWRHLFQTVNLEHEYDAVADAPSRGYLPSWTESLVYKRDPGEMAYDEAKGIAYDWLERVKGQEGVSATSARGEALRDYRLGLRYGDQDAAAKALEEYEKLGGTRKSLKQSIKRAHPLGPIAKKDRAEFLASLTEDQLDTFAEAEAYWKRVYAGE